MTEIKLLFIILAFIIDPLTFSMLKSRCEHYLNLISEVELRGFELWKPLGGVDDLLLVPW